MKYQVEHIHDSILPDQWRFPTDLMEGVPFKTARIKEAGYGWHDPEFFAERVGNRGFYVVVLSFTGRGKIEFEDGTSLILDPETVFISSPTGQGHREETYGNENWEHMWINLYPDAVFFKPEDFDHRTFKFTNGEMMSRLVRNLIFEAYYNDGLSSDAIDSYEKLIVLNLNRIFDLTDNYEMRTYRRKFTELWQMVASYPSRIWNVEELCDEAHYSRSQLTRICNMLYNMSPGQKVRAIKMDRALLLLMNSPLSVGEISEAIGYQDIYTFSAAFTRYYGQSPSEMRKRQTSS